MALLLAFGHTGMYAPGGIYTGDIKGGSAGFVFMGSIDVFGSQADPQNFCGPDEVLSASMCFL